MRVSSSELFHILNPNSARRPDVASFFAGSSWDHIWIERDTHPTHLETTVHWAVNEGRSGIAVWGGDGTLSRVVNALDNLGALEQLPVALVPAGTCNDFAREVKIPAWRKLLDDPHPLVERRVDVATMEFDGVRRVFINNAGFGRRPQARRTKRPNPIADIFRMRAESVEIVSRGAGDERRESFDALMGIVFNGPFFGGGMHFPGSVLVDDGILNGHFVKEQGRLGLLWSFFNGRRGKPFQNGRVSSFQGSTIEVASRGELFPQADGESVSKGAVHKISFGVMPGALRLLVPAAAQQSKG